MPIIKSAKKRVRVANKAAARNSKTKRSFREAIKGFHASLTSANASKAQSALDKAVKKGVMSKNKAARKKKQLAAAAKAAGVKHAKTSKPKTTPTKKTATKAPAKKPVAKKPASKK